MAPFRTSSCSAGGRRGRASSRGLFFTATTTTRERDGLGRPRLVKLHRAISSYTENPAVRKVSKKKKGKWLPITAPGALMAAAARFVVLSSFTGFPPRTRAISSTCALPFRSALLARSIWLSECVGGEVFVSKTRTYFLICGGWGRIATHSCRGMDVCAATFVFFFPS